ncbi:hypothetical protein L1987_21584 [Smallanthus sonchifolius]|uniref:Uncharacterized protein n=1 Tax=Smallanthus sonchifolius TaxID=185202 RepID=A0ACB9IUR7_9ASTR|nr:hypothetical protein L1987_21584 [Smallanthus sonchifolius]
MARKVDAEKLISYSDDLVQFLKNEKDINFLKHCVKQSDGLRSRCLSDHAGVQTSLQAITAQIKDLEEQTSFIEERSQFLNKLQQDEMKAMMKLSMHASVTNIIPDLNEQSKISGHIVDKEKKGVEKFEFNSQERSDFDTCNAIWKKIIRFLVYRRQIMPNDYGMTEESCSSWNKEKWRTSYLFHGH